MAALDAEAFLESLATPPAASANPSAAPAAVV
jgi:hypothetical protein